MPLYRLCLHLRKKLTSNPDLYRIRTLRGGLAERLNAPVLKTGKGLPPSRVRIPDPPPLNYINPCFYMGFLFYHIHRLCQLTRHLGSDWVLRLVTRKTAINPILTWYFGDSFPARLLGRPPAPISRQTRPKRPTCQVQCLPVQSAW